jgi:nucleoid-associated protein YgaU
MPIMRSDVKLGLAIGGVLLAVLIVYVLVVPGSEQGGAELATAEAGVEASAQNSNAGATTPQTGETSTASNSNSATEPQQQAEGSTGDPAEPASPAAPSDATASNATAGGFDWDKLLNGEAAGELPSMSAPQAVPMPNAQGPSNQLSQIGTTPAAAEPAVVPPVVTEPIVTQEATAQQPTTTTPPVEAEATAAAPARTHTVQPNETFSSIAAVAYGSPNFYPHIQRANPNIDPGRLKPGMKITLPDVSTVKPTAAAAAAADEAAIDPNSQYRVQPNDSLHRISIKLYGKSDRADKIYEINKETIGSDPAKVKPGMVLKLPESPTVTASSR